MLLKTGTKNLMIRRIRPFLTTSWTKLALAQHGEMNAQIFCQWNISFILVMDCLMSSSKVSKDSNQDDTLHPFALHICCNALSALVFIGIHQNNL